jgi:DNA-binding transcriptional regulator YhcF (GntR family)
MEFSHDGAIYQQIADHLCERILAGEWKEGERIPSVRELAEDIRVNPNTVIRSYGWLQELGIIHTQRGLGYFVAPEARARTLEMKRQSFVARELPRIFKTMELLGMSCDEMARLHEERKARKEESA